MSSMIEQLQKTKGRMQYEINESTVVAACNDGWKVGDQLGSASVLSVMESFVSTESYWTLKFSDGNKIYINGE